MSSSPRRAPLPTGSGPGCTVSVSHLCWERVLCCKTLPSPLAWLTCLHPLVSGHGALFHVSQPGGTYRNLVAPLDLCPAPLAAVPFTWICRANCSSLNRKPPESKGSGCLSSLPCFSIQHFPASPSPSKACHLWHYWHDLPGQRADCAVLWSQLLSQRMCTRVCACTHGWSVQLQQWGASQAGAAINPE